MTELTIKVSLSDGMTYKTDSQAKFLVGTFINATIRKPNKTLELSSTFQKYPPNNTSTLLDVLLG